MNLRKDVPDEALKNCSRCNKPAKGEFYKDSSSRTMYEVACVDRAYCQNETHSKYPHRAITAWNKRPIENALQARIEELENTIAEVHKIGHEAIIRKGINTEKTIGAIINLTMPKEQS